MFALRVRELVDHEGLLEQVSDRLRPVAAAANVCVVLRRAVLAAYLWHHAIANDRDVVIPSAFGQQAELRQSVKGDPHSVR